MRIVTGSTFVERRRFLMSTGAAIATQLLAGQAMLGGQMTTGVAERTSHVFGSSVAERLAASRE
jgi:hypothetical protein